MGRREILFVFNLKGEGVLYLESACMLITKHVYDLGFLIENIMLM